MIVKYEMLDAMEFPIKVYVGKVKDVFSLSKSKIDKLSLKCLIATDRISAFNHVLANQTIPYKGQVITTMSTFWFSQLRDVIPSHFIDQVGTNTLIVRPCEIIPIEVIVRSRIVGSLWRIYKSNQREIYGQQFMDGLQEGALFPEPLITPTTKARVNDTPIGLNEPISMGLVSCKEWEYIKEVSLELFNTAKKLIAPKGLELVDWKLEFGRLNDGTIILADEIGTPDSSRFMSNENYLDKEIIRSYLKDSGVKDIATLNLPQELVIKASQAYQTASSLITGKQVIPYSRGQILHDVIDYQESLWVS